MSAQSIFQGRNIVLILLALLLYLLSSSVQNPESTLFKLFNPQPTPTSTMVPQVEEDIIEEHEPDADIRAQQDVEGIASERQIAEVVKVIDGDTIEVSINGNKEKVRIIGLNTPETVDPRRGVQCFGREASAFAKQLLNGQIVQLESDPSQQERDKYGRLLRFVWLQNGTVDFGKRMIEEGYGQEYTYEVPYKYQTIYKSMEQTAREMKKGLWSDLCVN